MDHYNVKLAVVKYNEKCGVWHKKDSTQAELIEETDLNNVDLQKFTDKRASFLVRKNWFLSYNGMLYINFGSGATFNTNFRTGTFLLKNRWDAAFSLGMSLSDATLSFNIGINSRYYHPIRKIRLSPYAGLGIGLVANGDMDEMKTSFDFIPSLGVSWGLGPGSLDLGLQYGTSSKFMILFGYTFFPFSSKTTSASRY